MNKIPRALKFWLGCIVIVVASFVQTAHPWFPGTFCILLAMGWCAWQFHRTVKQLKKSIAEEKSIRAAADRYIHARVRKS